MLSTCRPPRNSWLLIRRLAQPCMSGLSLDLRRSGTRPVISARHPFACRLALLDEGDLVAFGVGRGGDQHFVGGRVIACAGIEASLSHGGKLMIEIVEVKCQQRPAGPIGACYELDNAPGWNVPLGEAFHR